MVVLLLIAGLGYRELVPLRLSAEVHGTPLERFNDEPLPCLHSVCQIQSVPAKQAMEKIPSGMPMRGEPPMQCQHQPGSTGSCVCAANTACIAPQPCSHTGSGRLFRGLCLEQSCFGCVRRNSKWCPKNRNTPALVAVLD